MHCNYTRGVAKFVVFGLESVECDGMNTEDVKIGDCRY